MSTKVTDFYAEVRELEKSLQDDQGREIFITSKRNRDKGSVEGQTCSATPKRAAECIVNETHRLASKIEVDAFFELQRENLRKSNANEAKKKQTLVLHQTNPESIAAPETDDEVVPASSSAKR